MLYFYVFFKTRGKKQMHQHSLKCLHRCWSLFSYWHLVTSNPSVINWCGFNCVKGLQWGWGPIHLSPPGNLHLCYIKGVLVYGYRGWMIFAQNNSICWWHNVKKKLGTSEQNHCIIGNEPVHSYFLSKQNQCIENPSIWWKCAINLDILAIAVHGGTKYLHIGTDKCHYTTVHYTADLAIPLLGLGPQYLCLYIVR